MYKGPDAGPPTLLPLMLGPGPGLKIAPAVPTIDADPAAAPAVVTAAPGPPPTVYPHDEPPLPPPPPPRAPRPPRPVT